ncbi:MAG: RluA family pseudouridine synthase [Anaerolineae bacterium]|nr:RluA family pseudouridine synthase [Anaerolineae bacterium]
MINPNQQDGPSTNRIFIVDQPGLRIDKFLVECFPEHSRSRVQAWIKEGYVTIAGETISKTGYKLDTGLEITVKVPPTKDVGLIPEDIPLDVVFENDDLIVINKPAGMVVHPSAGHESGTLVHAVLAHAPELEGIGGEYRPGVVHRLDKDTSGLILFAKNDTSLRWLQAQFKKRQVEKYYLTLVDGHPPTDKGRIEAPIGRDIGNRQKMAVVAAKKGKSATSEYEVLQKFKNHSLVRVRILTGRTHQIRLHMNFLGCPVVGDRIYGRRHSSVDIARQFLHAEELRILLPEESTPRRFKAELPPELVAVITNLR